MNILKVLKLINFCTFTSVQHNKTNPILYVRDKISPSLQVCFKKIMLLESSYISNLTQMWATSMILHSKNNLRMQISLQIWCIISTMGHSKYLVPLDGYTCDHSTQTMLESEVNYLLE